MISTRIVFDHRGRTEKGSDGPLEIRVTIDRKAYYVNTGVKVQRSEWKYDSVVNRPDQKELNDRLVILLRKVEQEINVCLEEGRPIDVAEIRRKVNESNTSVQNSDAFLNWLDSEIEVLMLTEGTKKHYRTLAMRLRQFGGIRGWNEVTAEQIIKFDYFLNKIGSVAKSSLQNGVFGDSERKISTAGIYNYHKCFKAILNRAEAIGKIGRNPYAKLKGKFRRGDKESLEYLTEDEMHKIEALDFEPGTILRKSRDLFIFQMYTGMAYSDAQNFDIEDYKLVDGKYINRQERVKTGVAFLNQLLPPVVEILKQYGMKVPNIDLSDHNRSLKAIGAAVGIKTKMHSHLARHTFATYMLRNGVKIENLQRMLGHNSIVTTQRYAKVLAQSVHEDFDMVAEKMTGKKKK